MSSMLVHLVVADKLYNKLKTDISNAALFFSGNLAPDAIHARKNYKRKYKRKTHLREGIPSYAYGNLELSKQYSQRIYDFIDKHTSFNYKNKDLYLGYAAHLLLDKFNIHTSYNSLKNKLQIHSEIELLEEINKGDHKEYLDSFNSFNDTCASQYVFTNNIVRALEAVWDYEIEQYVSVEEINENKRWVLDKLLINHPKKEQMQMKNKKGNTFFDDAAEHIYKQLQSMI